MRARQISRRLLSPVALAGAAGLIASLVPAASAAPTTPPDGSPNPSIVPVSPAAKNTDRGPGGNRIAVSRVTLSASGGSVVVRGRGFDRRVGIYVGLCVTPRPGQKPSPCGGGADTDGSSQASAWISSNPPPYGRNLAVPYGRNGSFKVRLKVSPFIRTQTGTIDCRVTSCAITTRADHTRASDRRWDLAVPVRFR